jgi:hypothetical protein
MRHPDEGTGDKGQQRQRDGPYPDMIGARFHTRPYALLPGLLSIALADGCLSSPDSRLARAARPRGPAKYS